MPKNKSCEFHAQEVQLVMSLKFHFRETLSKIPVDVALNAMSNVWESCQDDVDNDKTLVCTREELNRSLWH